jgi:hypothetical protein
MDVDVVVVVDGGVDVRGRGRGRYSDLLYCRTTYCTYARPQPFHGCRVYMDSVDRSLPVFILVCFHPPH